MLRALIAAALLTGATLQFLGTPPDVALGYSLALCLTLWFTWPVGRFAARLICRARRRRLPHRTAPSAPTPAPQLTQINHHHYYYGGIPGDTAATGPHRVGTAPTKPPAGGPRRDLRHHRPRRHQPVSMGQIKICRPITAGRTGA